MARYRRKCAALQRKRAATETPTASHATSRATARRDRSTVQGGAEGAAALSASAIQNDEREPPHEQRCAGERVTALLTARSFPQFPTFFAGFHKWLCDRG